MLKVLTFAAAIGAAALIGGTAAALPLSPAKQAGIESDVTLVRDGCGRGYRFSRSRQACVPEYGGGPYRSYREPYREPRRRGGDAAAAAAAAAATIGIISAIEGGRRVNRGRVYRDRRVAPQRRW